ncbi:MAG: Hpt domain-containing protein, partial [Gammaproteobacteria bacterium]
MSDTNEALWQAFYAEVSEQLQELELLLVRSDVNESEQVDSVFRLFHTIKSSAAMMAYTSMEHLAHDCEDLLDLARKRTIELDAAIVDVLLKAVDHLKFQLDQTQKTRENPPENAPLIEEIQSLLKKAGKGGGPPATASGETSAPAANSSNSDGEVSEILGTYAAVCRDNLPRLFAVHASAKARKATRNAIEKLRQGSDDVGFHGVSALLRKLEAMPSGANPDDDRLRLRLKADIIDKLRYAERIAGMDWGLAELSAELAVDHKIQLRRHLETAVASLNAIFGDLTATRTEGMASRLSAVLIPVEDAVNLTRIIGFETTASLLTLIRQVLRDLTRGSLDCTAELVEMVRIAVALPLEISGDESESEHYRILCEETLEELRRVLAGGEGAETTGTKLQRIRAVLEIGQDYLDLLTPRAVSDLLEIVNRREQVIEIEADLEKDPETGESFVQWLTDNGRIISNRTVIHREKRGGKETERAALRFLVQSDTPAAELKEALGSLDPDRRLFELHLCRYKDEIPDAGTASDTESARSPSRPPQHGQAADTVRIDSETLDGFVSR